MESDKFLEREKRGQALHDEAIDLRKQGIELTNTLRYRGIIVDPRGLEPGAYKDAIEETIRGRIVNRYGKFLDPDLQVGLISGALDIFSGRSAEGIKLLKMYLIDHSYEFPMRFLVRSGLTGEVIQYDMLQELRDVEPGMCAENNGRYAAVVLDPANPNRKITCGGILSPTNTYAIDCLKRAGELQSDRNFFVPLSNGEMVIPDEDKENFAVNVVTAFRNDLLDLIEINSKILES